MKWLEERLEARIKWVSKIIDQKVRKLLMTTVNYKKKLI